MRNLFKRSAAILLTLAFFISPVSNFLNPKIKADNVWIPLTDSNFAENNSVIFQLIGFNGGIIWGTNNKVFLFGGGPGGDISGNIFDNDAHLLNLVFSGDNLFALTLDDLGTYKFWVSPEAGEWFDNSSIFNDIPNFIGATFMGMYSNTLTFEILTDNEGDTESAIYVLDGESLIPITDSTTFQSMSIPLNYLSVVKVVDYIGGSAMYLVENLQNGKYFLYRFNGESFELFHFFADGYVVSDLATFNDTIYVYAYIDNENPTIEYFDGLGFSSPADTFEQQEFSGKLLVSGSNLYIGTSRYDSGFARIFSLDTSNNFSLLVDHVGDISETEGLNNSYITGLTAVGPFLVAAAAFPGEGPYHPSIWIYGPEADSDGDGVLDSVENEGPNAGDANQDGILDSSQENVKSFVNPVTNDYVTLATSCSAVTSADVVAENTLTADSAFNYPTGLLDFTLSCNVGETATINQYFFGDYSANLFVARKYNPNTQTYSTITGASVTNYQLLDVNIGIKVSYQVTDGGSLDQDGAENGIIVDPSGPALNSVLVPNTGIGGLH